MGQPIAVWIAWERAIVGDCRYLSMALPAIYSGDPTGATWVFTRSNGVWTQQGTKLVGTGTPGNAE
jgi:hypothetical protein